MFDTYFSFNDYESWTCKRIGSQFTADLFFANGEPWSWSVMSWNEDTLKEISKGKHQTGEKC